MPITFLRKRSFISGGRRGRESKREREREGKETSWPCRSESQVQVQPEPILISRAGGDSFNRRRRHHGVRVHGGGRERYRWRENTSAGDMKRRRTQTGIVEPARARRRDLDGCGGRRGELETGGCAAVRGGHGGSGGGLVASLGLELRSLELLAFLLVRVLVSAESLRVGELSAAVLALEFFSFSRGGSAVGGHGRNVIVLLEMEAEELHPRAAVDPRHYLERESKEESGGGYACERGGIYIRKGGPF